MKITTTENNEIQLEEVYNSIILKTTDGEEMVICMRDTGFEFKYQGEMYFAKEGQVKPFYKSERGNYLVNQTPLKTEDKENINHEKIMGQKKLVEQLIDFLDYADPIYWGENECTDRRQLINEFLKSKQ